MTGTFTVRIVLGNDAMSTFEDIASALRRVEVRITSGEEDGKVADRNGNTVGVFTMRHVGSERGQG